MLKFWSPIEFKLILLEMFTKAQVYVHQLKKGNEQEVPKTRDSHVPSKWCPNLTKEICKQQLNR